MLQHLHIPQHIEQMHPAVHMWSVSHDDEILDCLVDRGKLAQPNKCPVPL